MHCSEILTCVAISALHFDSRLPRLRQSPPAPVDCCLSRLRHSQCAMLATLKPVSIVIAGCHTLPGQKLLSIAEKKPDKYMTIDVRKWLHKDPASSKLWQVRHTENSEALPCQLSLLHDRRFADCVSEVVKTIVDHHAEKKVFVVCSFFFVFFFWEGEARSSSSTALLGSTAAMASRG